jgi:hypothetical protein
MKKVHGNAKSTVVLKKGRAIMANTSKARVFGSKIAAVRFVRNLITVSNSLKMKDFEFITM